MPTKMIEVDEIEYANQQALLRLNAAIMADPKSRELMTRAAKHVNPKASTPELDAKEEIRAELAAERAEREKLAKQIEDDRAERAQQAQLSQFQSNWDKQKADLRKQGWQDEGIEKIEAMAHELGIPNLAVAASHFEKLNPPEPVSKPSSIGGFDLFNPTDRDSEHFKKLMEAGADGDPMVENAMISDALKDFRAGRR